VAVGAAATGVGGCAPTGGLATTGPAGGAAAMAGRGSAGGAAAAPTGGLATTGPAGGLAAMAGGCGGLLTMGAAGRGCGTILRGAGFATSGSAAGAADAACGAGAAAGLAGAGAAGRGLAAAAASCSFFCRMAFRTSPGLDTFDRSILGLGAASAREPPGAAFPRWRWARTRAASSSSSELECVFFSVTPTASRTSRMALLFTSSSRARSLIRTLLIRPFVLAPDL